MSSGGGSSSSSNDESNSNSNENNFSNKKLGSDSHFVLMAQADGVGLFRIISDETDLDTSVLPQTVRPLKLFDTTQEAISFLAQYDEDNNH